MYGNSFKYLVFFPLTWAILRFGARGKSTAIFITAGIAAVGTVFGHGPFGRGDGSGLLGLQIFIGSIASVFLVLASIAEERRNLMGELEEYVENLEGTLKTIRFENESVVIELPAELPRPEAKESRKKRMQ